MHGPRSHTPDAQPDEHLVLLTTDRESGGVTGAIALGADWDLLLGALVADAGRRAQQEPGA